MFKPSINAASLVV